VSWLALAIAAGASIRYYASGVPLVLSDVVVHLLGYAIVAVLLMRAGARMPTARMLLALFIAWQLALAGFNLAVGSAQLPGLYGLDKLILAVQVMGVVLLFAPASNAWFRKRN